MKTRRNQRLLGGGRTFLLSCFYDIYTLCLFETFSPETLKARLRVLGWILRGFQNLFFGFLALDRAERSCEFMASRGLDGILSDPKLGFGK